MGVTLSIFCTPNMALEQRGPHGAPDPAAQRREHKCCGDGSGDRRCAPPQSQGAAELKLPPDERGSLPVCIY